MAQWHKFCEALKHCLNDFNCGLSKTKMNSICSFNCKKWTSSAHIGAIDHELNRDLPIQLVLLPQLQTETENAKY